jgi:hypothetical protein
VSKLELITGDLADGCVLIPDDVLRALGWVPLVPEARDLVGTPRDAVAELYEDRLFYQDLGCRAAGDNVRETYALLGRWIDAP